MTEEQIRTLIFNTLVKEIVRRVTEKLVERQKNALVVCTGATIGFSQWISSLKTLREKGFTFDLFLSQNAVRVLDIPKITREIAFGKVWSGDCDQMPERLVVNYPTVLVPALTVKSAVEIASCMADTPASRMVFNAMMRGKNVIIATDACCPDNEERKAKGYRIAPPLQKKLRENIKQLRDYGATLATAATLAEKTCKAIRFGEWKNEEDRNTRKNRANDIVKNETVKTVRFAKKIISRQDVTSVLSGSTIAVPENCQITNLAADIARERGINIVRE